MRGPRTNAISIGKHANVAFEAYRSVYQFSTSCSHLSLCILSRKKSSLSPLIMKKWQRNVDIGINTCMFAMYCKDAHYVYTNTRSCPPSCQKNATFTLKRMFSASRSFLNFENRTIIKEDKVNKNTIYWGPDNTRTERP